MDNKVKILNISNLLPGDILLYRPCNPNFIQRKISEKTGSPYTHASIYIGDGLIAEAVFPFGVRICSFKKLIKGSGSVAVLRSQTCFSGDRPNKLKIFVQTVQKPKRFYDWISVVTFTCRSEKYFGNQLDFIIDNYGTYEDNDSLSKRLFFCSCFVVACYSAVGIIDKNAQTAYKPENFSPAHLYKDPTFGWLLGFITCYNKEDEHILKETTNWEDCPDKWWKS